MRLGSGSSRSNAVVVGDGLPQVNLLPESVRAARGFKRIGRWLAIYGLVVLVVLVGVFALAWSTHQDAKSELAAEQHRSEVLVLEQAKYSHVPKVLAEVENTENALWYAMSTEVLWRPYFRAIAATAPEDVSFDTISYTGGSPLEPPTVTTPWHQEMRVGAVTFVARSLTVPDTATWIENLEAVPGFTRAWFSDATISAVEEDTFYIVNGQVELTERAWAQRFVPESMQQETAPEQENGGGE